MQTETPFTGVLLEILERINDGCRSIHLTFYLLIYRETEGGRITLAFYSQAGYLTEKVLVALNNHSIPTMLPSRPTVF